MEEEADEAAQEEAPKDEAEIQVGRSMECSASSVSLHSVAVYRIIQFPLVTESVMYLKVFTIGVCP